jgi:hypothetical protein
MLALHPVPPDLESLDAHCRDMGVSLREGLELSGEVCSPRREENVLARFPDAWIFIREGTFHYRLENSPVRFFSRGSWIFSGTGKEGATVSTDFGSEVEAFPAAELAAALARDPDRLRRFLECAALQERVAARLCALQALAPMEAPIEVKRYVAGDVILREGDKAYEIFELVQGSAAVAIQGREIARIGEGQIFGELSFFTDSDRFATVTAEEDCLVQAMDKDVFLDLMRRRPHMVDSLVRTLCRRLVEANAKLAP